MQVMAQQEAEQPLPNAQTAAMQHGGHGTIRLGNIDTDAVLNPQTASSFRGYWEETPYIPVTGNRECTREIKAIF